MEVKSASPHHPVAPNRKAVDVQVRRQGPASASAQARQLTRASPATSLVEGGGGVASAGEKESSCSNCETAARGRVVIGCAVC